MKILTIAVSTRNRNRMPRFAANLAYLFAERPLIERFGAAAAAGFSAVELLFPYEVAASAVKSELARHDLTPLGVNTPFGREGEAGLAAVPGREREWETGFARALDYAVAIGGRTVHCMAGCIPPEQRPAAETVFIRNLAKAAAEAETAGITLLIEPLNPRDRPAISSIASSRPPISSPRSAAPICAFSSIFITHKSSAAISSGASKHTCRSSAMFRSPAFRRARSRMKAKSIIRKFSRPSTDLATQASSAASTGHAAAPRTAWAGRGLTASFRAADDLQRGGPKQADRPRIGHSFIAFGNPRGGRHCCWVGPESIVGRRMIRCG